MSEPMTKRDVLLAAMAAGSREEFTPVQLQKLLFLIDKNVGPTLGGPFFDFQPYDYGPFDAAVYREADALVVGGFAAIEDDYNPRRYRLNQAGRAAGDAALQKMSEPTADYLRRLAPWVQSLSFSELVSSVYKAYPEMKVNSVFRD